MQFLRRHDSHYPIGEIGKSYGEKVFIFCTFAVTCGIGEGRFAAIIGNFGEGGCRRHYRQSLFVHGQQRSIPKTNVGKCRPADRSKQNTPPQMAILIMEKGLSTQNQIA